MSQVHKQCYMELILGISEETNFLESVFISLPKFLLLLHRQTLASDFKKLGDYLGVQLECSQSDGGISTAIKKKNYSVRRTNSAQDINSADRGIDFTFLFQWKDDN